MYRSRLWLNLVLVVVVALLAIFPGAALAATPAATSENASAAISSSASAAINSNASAAPGYVWYRVRRGDTLANIAWRYHTTAVHLKAVNHIRNANVIYAGQWIRIPGWRR